MICGVLITGLVLVLSGCGNKKKKKLEHKQYPGYSSSELLQMGKKELKKGHTTDGQNYLKAVIKRGDNEEIIPEATLLLADSYYEQGTVSSYADAIYQYRSFMKYYPRHRRAPYARYQVGMCYYEQRESPDRDLTPVKNALEAFRKVVNNYKNSLYVGPAKKKIRKCRQFFAEREFLIGKFYYQRGSYDAAIKRLKRALEKYSKIYEEPKLYYFLGQSYWESGKRSKGEYYFSKLIRRFPSSKPAEEAKKRLEGKPSPKSVWDKFLPPYF